MNNLYKLNLHSVLEVNGLISVLRVPGGWIYITQTMMTGEFSTCFVPFNNEFQNETNNKTDRTDKDNREDSV